CGEDGCSEHHLAAEARRRDGAEPGLWLVLHRNGRGPDRQGGGRLLLGAEADGDVLRRVRGADGGQEALWREPAGALVRHVMLEVRFTSTIVEWRGPAPFFYA